VKIYYHPVSTTSRPLMLFASESGIDVEFQVVDLLTGEHMKPGYASINPSHLVPVLEDGDFRLTESSAILKYLAEKTDSPAYPKDLRQRAKVNEMMDWFNTQICRDFAYGLVYPQIFPGQHRRPSDEQQQGTLAWAKERTKGWLKVLNQDLIARISGISAATNLRWLTILARLSSLLGKPFAGTMRLTRTSSVGLTT
jgi:glutathione S-transferase